MSALNKSDLRREFAVRYGSQLSRPTERQLVVLTDELNRLLGPGSDRRIAAFYPYQHEPDLREWYRSRLLMGNRLAFPAYDLATQQFCFRWLTHFDHDFAPGKFGIMAPKNECVLVTPEELKTDQLVWLIPGLLFDHFGGRLGRGKGIYDQLLAGTQGLKIGIGFDWQMVSVIPRETWDISMNIVITNRATIEVIS